MSKRQSHRVFFEPPNEPHSEQPLMEKVNMKQPMIVAFHPLGTNSDALIALDNKGQLWRRVPAGGKYVWEIIPGPTLADETTLRPSTPC
jgi:hypothetical protein